MSRFDANKIIRKQVKVLYSDRINPTVARAVILAISCLISFQLMTGILGHNKLVSPDDNLLGGMWAVIATVFVFQDSFSQSMGAALLRMGATCVSFGLCLAYLLILPFHAWGMAALIGAGAVAVTLFGHPQAVITTGITTTVVMVVAALSPHDAWRQPILRLLDTAVGVVVGLGGAWIARRVYGEDSSRHEGAS